MTRSEFEYRKYVQPLGISESDEIYGFGFKCYLQGINDNFKVVEEIALPEIAKCIEDCNKRRKNNILETKNISEKITLYAITIHIA